MCKLMKWKTQIYHYLVYIGANVFAVTTVERTSASTGLLLWILLITPKLALTVLLAEDWACLISQQWFHLLAVITLWHWNFIMFCRPNARNAVFFRFSERALQAEEKECLIKRPVLSITHMPRGKKDLIQSKSILSVWCTVRLQL